MATLRRILETYAQEDVRPAGSLPHIGGSESGWIAVNSDAIEKIRFTLTDRKASVGSLQVKFKSKPSSKPADPNNKLSTVYEYIAVPEVVFLALLEDSAPARYFASRIKNAFAYQRLTLDEVARDQAAVSVKKMTSSPVIPDEDEVDRAIAAIESRDTTLGDDFEVEF